MSEDVKKNTLTNKEKEQIKNAILDNAASNQTANPLELAKLLCDAINYITSY